MKLSNKYIKSATAVFAVAALLFSTGCTKEDNYGTPPDSSVQGSQIVDRRTQEDIKDFSERMPAISWYNSTMNKIITVDPKSEQKSFSFSDPNPGWNFSDASETYWAPAPQGGGILFIGSGSFGTNSGGGTVVAGQNSLNIASTFCFSASEEALGLDIGGFGGPDFDGISGVIGIAGDLEALSTGEFDEESNIFDYFQGMAYYVVYDNEASGNYDILNWFDNLAEEPDDLGGNGFSWVYSFSESEWALYFSQNGSLNVSGGSMNFEGNYFGLILDIDDIFSENGGDIVDLEFVQNQFGIGQMGCN